DSVRHNHLATFGRVFLNSREGIAQNDGPQRVAQAVTVLGKCLVEVVQRGARFDRGRPASTVAVDTLYETSRQFRVIAQRLAKLNGAFEFHAIQATADVDGGSVFGQAVAASAVELLQ